MMYASSLLRGRRRARIAPERILSLRRRSYPVRSTRYQYTLQSDFSLVFLLLLLLLPLLLLLLWLPQRQPQLPLLPDRYYRLLPCRTEQSLDLGAVLDGSGNILYGSTGHGQSRKPG